MKHIVLTLLLIPSVCFGQCNDDRHLFILTGQSNMYWMPLRYFSDAVDGEIGGNHTIYVKHAIGGMPISMWDEALNGSIYTTLMNRVDDAVGDTDLASITVIWMQGEQDTIFGREAHYLASFDNVYSQFVRDLGRDNFRLIVGRINDYGVSDAWQYIRDILEFIGDTYPDAVWIDTDDLNGPYDGPHCPLVGYKTLAERYAGIVLSDICGD